MNTNNEAICREVIRIMVDKIHYPEEVLVKENWDKPLTGKVLRLSSVDLTYLFLEVEKAFCIRIPESCLRGYGFSTINGIIDTVCKCKMIG